MYVCMYVYIYICVCVYVCIYEHRIIQAEWRIYYALLN